MPSLAGVQKEDDKEFKVTLSYKAKFEANLCYMRPWGKKEKGEGGKRGKHEARKPIRPCCTGCHG